MAIDKKLRDELAKHVNLGSECTYFSRKNPKDLKTRTDLSNSFEKALKNKNYLEILQAIYDVSSDKKYNGAPFTVSQQGSKYLVTDIKTSKSGELDISVTKTKFQVSDKITGKTTVIELGGVVDTEKSETKLFRDQIADILKFNTTDKEVMAAIKNVMNNYKG